MWVEQFAAIWLIFSNDGTFFEHCNYYFVFHEFRESWVLGAHRINEEDIVFHSTFLLQRYLAKAIIRWMSKQISSLPQTPLYGERWESFLYEEHHRWAQKGINNKVQLLRTLLWISILMQHMIFRANRVYSTSGDATTFSRMPFLAKALFTLFKAFLKSTKSRWNENVKSTHCFKMMPERTSSCFLSFKLSTCYLMFRDYFRKYICNSWKLANIPPMVVDRFYSVWASRSQR